MSRSAPLILSRKCVAEGCGGTIRAALDRVGPIDATCSLCRRAERVQGLAEIVTGTAIERCPACDGREFFVRRDFPQRLGLGLVVIFGLLASVFYYFERIGATFAILGGLVFVDAVIYLFVGPVTICYRCRAELRGLDYDSKFGGFDLATAEKYRSAAALREKLSRPGPE